MHQIGNSFTSIEQVTNQYLNQNSSFVSKTSDDTASFEDLLLKKYSENTVSSKLKDLPPSALERKLMAPLESPDTL